MFMVIFMLLTMMLMLIFHVLGAQFDDGSTFDEGYDNDHNDYQMLPYPIYSSLAALRNAIGDLHAPSYEYWVDLYQTEQSDYWTHLHPLIMIGVIWFFYLLLILTQVILALNFLIAIVSDSYDNIMDR